MTAKLVATAILLGLAACATPRDRDPQQKTSVTPGFPSRDVVEVAILPPRVHSPDGTLLAAHFREAARRVLIDRKLYSVPQDGFVDEALRILPQAPGSPGRAAEAAGADAGLEIVVNQWETGDLLPKGRLYAGGEMTLHRQDATLWKLTFKDKLVLAPTSVTTSNRNAIVEAMIRNLTRDLLASLPPKPQR